VTTDNINRVYFIGVGGIGMSALARYFKFTGKKVAGYDLTSTPLTAKLSGEGIEISFSDDVKTIPLDFLNEETKEMALVVYTPAIPANNRIFRYFKESGYKVVKRSVLLGSLINEEDGIAIAGTHGKTSVSVLIAHLLRQSSVGCNAFLGGVAKNYGTNLLVSGSSKIMVVEADEYDRSFLQLLPQTAVITSMDPDHLDVYGDVDRMKKAFSAFVRQVKAGGTVIYKVGLDLGAGTDDEISYLSYGLDQGADYFARNIRMPADGLPLFDLVTPYLRLNDLKLGVPGIFNVENAVAAVVAALVYRVTEEEIRTGLESFKGIHRRFDVKINTPDCVFIDDYAHHPVELKACINAAREWFPNRRITGIFQPHLYSRTRDFAGDFAKSLDALDDVIILDIYPAREEPVPGVSSGLIFNKLKSESKVLCSREELPDIIAGLQTDVVITMGAGNIDALVEPLRNILLAKSEGRS
jgi:UDP-N-acetylmuramate--alanine ligase